MMGMDSPGPGAYTYDSMGKKGGFALGKATRGGGRYEDAPGPGQYNGGQSAFDTRKGPSLKGRYSMKSKFDSPGPGSYAYEKDPTRSSAPAFRMGGRHNTNGDASNPGPQYDPRIDVVRSRAPAAGFGKAGRGGNKFSDSPGPGNYNMNTSLGKKGFKMGGKNYGKNGGPDAPGPGAYQYRSTLESRGPKMGGASRSGGNRNSMGPGPGAYSYEDKNNGGAAFGKDARGKMSKLDGPGPGNYDAPSFL